MGIVYGWIADSPPNEVHPTKRKFLLLDKNLCYYFCTVLHEHLKMKKLLTPRQSEILAIIKEYKYSHDSFPSIRKLAERIGVKSPNAVKQHLDALIAKGYINKNENKYRLLGNSEYVQIKVLGYANAGQPLSFAEENNMGLISIKNEKIKDSQDHFAVVVQGDSMDQQKVNGKNILDGYYAIVKRTENYDDKDTVLAVVNGAATIKNITNRDGYVILYPNSSNKKHREIFIDSDEELFINGEIIDVLPSFVEK